MRILMVIDANDGRGLFRHAYVLAKKLAVAGWHVAIAHIDHDEGMIEDEGVRVYKFAGYMQHAAFLYSQRDIRHHGSMPDGLAIRKLARIIEAEKPDLIHTHGWVTYSVAALRNSLGIPIVTTLHDYGFFCPTKILLRDNNESCYGKESLCACLRCGSAHYGLLKSAMTLCGVRKNFKLLNSGIDRYFAVSSFVRESYVAAGFPDDRMELMPNFYMGNESAGDQKTIPTLQLPEAFILFVGLLSKHKGVNLLVNAYRKLKTDVKLVLIGSKQTGFECDSGDNIIIMENQPHDVVMAAWQRALFGVVPSIWPEPCPTVALEAMASKKALVASDAGGIRDIVVHGETGYLYESCDERDMMNYLMELIEHPGRTQEMGIRGYQRVQDYFSVDRVKERIQIAYR